MTDSGPFLQRTYARSWKRKKKCSKLMESSGCVQNCKFVCLYHRLKIFETKSDLRNHTEFVSMDFSIRTQVRTIAEILHSILHVLTYELLIQHLCRWRTHRREMFPRNFCGILSLETGVEITIESHISEASYMVLCHVAKQSTDRRSCAVPQGMSCLFISIERRRSFSLSAMPRDPGSPHSFVAQS